MRKILIPSVVLGLALPALECGKAQVLAPTVVPAVFPQGKKKKKPKLKPQVRYAQTWEAAVEEAKLLKVPLVIHSHGFN